MPDLVAAVAEPNRRRLLQLLGAGEQTVSQLASHFTVSRSAISQHLGVLADSGLVTSRRSGKFQYYRLNARGMAALVPNSMPNSRRSSATLAICPARRRRSRLP